jgi:ribonuclease P protein component
VVSADRSLEPDPPTGTPATQATSLRLPRERRVRRSRDFKQLYAGGRRFAQGRFTAVVRANGLGVARLGLSIAARAAPLAVDRNRVRRLIRESFRHHQTRLPAADIVVGLRGGLADADNRQLRHALEQLWQKLSSCESL